MLPLPDSKRAAGRRIAEALLDPLVRGVRAATGRGVPAGSAAPPPPSQAAAVPPDPPAPAPAPVSGEDAAARIDEARTRLRARIAPPADDDPA